MPFSIHDPSNEAKEGEDDSQPWRQLYAVRSVRSRAKEGDEWTESEIEENVEKRRKVMNEREREKWTASENEEKR